MTVLLHFALILAGVAFVVLMAVGIYCLAWTAVTVASGVLAWWDERGQA